MLQDPGTFSRQGFRVLIRICWQHTCRGAKLDPTRASSTARWLARKPKCLERSNQHVAAEARAQDSRLKA